MHSEFMEALENSPVIAAVKDDDGLKKCLKTDSSIVFILYGDICNIPQIVETVKSAGKIAMVHVDLIHGLSPKEIAIDFIHQYTKADGIISTKALLIKRASELGLYTIHRFFVIDSMAYESIFKTMRTGKPDCIRDSSCTYAKSHSKALQILADPGHCRRYGFRKRRHYGTFTGRCRFRLIDQSGYLVYLI